MPIEAYLCVNITEVFQDALGLLAEVSDELGDYQNIHFHKVLIAQQTLSTLLGNLSDETQEEYENELKYVTQYLEGMEPAILINLED